MTTDPRLTPSVIARLRALPRNVAEAMLRLLRRPPPSTGDWPKIAWIWSSDWDLFRLDAGKGAVGGSFTATGPTSGMGQMVLLADYGKVHKGYVVQDCEVRVGPGAQRQWGARCYDVVDWIIRRCKLYGPMQEHGLYLNAPGGLLIEDCYFRDFGGAGIQIAFRKVEGQYAHESTDPLLAAQPSQHIYRRVTIEQCGHPDSDRFGAYLISEHAAEVNWQGYVSKRINAEIVIDACVVRGGNLDMNYKGQHIRSTRGLLVQERPSLTVIGSTIDVPQPMDGWNSQIWGVDHVVLRDSTFNGGTIEIRGAKSVTIENCKGTANVIVGHGDWNKWPMHTVEHSGPISAGYSK